MTALTVPRATDLLGSRVRVAADTRHLTNGVVTAVHAVTDTRADVTVTTRHGFTRGWFTRDAFTRP